MPKIQRPGDIRGLLDVNVKEIPVTSSRLPTTASIVQVAKNDYALVTIQRVYYSAVSREEPESVKMCKETKARYATSLDTETDFHSLSVFSSDYAVALPKLSTSTPLPTFFFPPQVFASVHSPSDYIHSIPTAKALHLSPSSTSCFLT